MIIAGLTTDAKDVPGPFGNYQLATTHKFDRAVGGGSGKDTLMEENWEFVSASGERLEVHLKYQRAAARKLTQEVKFFNPTNPASFQIFKVDSAIDIMRNATVPVKDRVTEFSYKASGGRLGPLFDGTEKVVSIDFLPLVQPRRLHAVVPLASPPPHSPSKTGVNALSLGEGAHRNRGQLLLPHSTAPGGFTMKLLAGLWSPAAWHSRAWPPTPKPIRQADHHHRAVRRRQWHRHDARVTAPASRHRAQAKCRGRKPARRERRARGHRTSRARRRTATR